MGTIFVKEVDYCFDASKSKNSRKKEIDCLIKVQNETEELKKILKIALKNVSKQSNANSVEKNLMDLIKENDVELDCEENTGICTIKDKNLLRFLE